MSCGGFYSSDESYARQCAESTKRWQKEEKKKKALEKAKLAANLYFNQDYSVDE